MFVVLFIALPSIIIVAWIVTRDTTPNESANDSRGAIQSGVDSEASEAIHDSSPDLTQTPQNNENSGSVHTDPPITNILVYDFEAGVMTFLFAPESQTALDENIVSKIRELLTSPKNTEDALTTVAIPQLSDDDSEVLTDAIINAFESLEIPLSVIIFNVYQPASEAQEFEVTISFQ